MKTKMVVDQILNARPIIGNGIVLELEMTEGQMYAALNHFLENVTDETWAKWQALINTDIYGEKEARMTAAAPDLLNMVRDLIDALGNCDSEIENDARALVAKIDGAAP